MIAWWSSNADPRAVFVKHIAIRAAERYGCAQEQLVKIFGNILRTHPAFSEAERAALDFSLQASQVPNNVDAEIKRTGLLQDGKWSEIVEMLALFLCLGILNRMAWNDSMGLHWKMVAGSKVDDQY